MEGKTDKQSYNIQTLSSKLIFRFTGLGPLRCVCVFVAVGGERCVFKCMSVGVKKGVYRL